MHVANNGVLQMDSSAIALIEDVSEDSSNALVGSPAMGQVFVDHGATQTTYTYSFTAKAPPGETSHAAIKAGAILTMDWFPDGDASGKVKHSVDIVIGSVGKSWSVGGETKMNVSASSKSVPVESVVP